MNDLYIGGTYVDGAVTDYAMHFSNSDMSDVSMQTNVSLVSNELAIDMLTVTVRYASYLAELFSPRDFDAIETADDFVFATNAPEAHDIGAMKFGTPTYWLRDGSLLGKFFVSQVRRINRDRYRITAVSAIGLLNTRYHMGGIYSGVRSGHRAADLIASIMDDGAGNPIVPYACDTAVGNTYVYGWLPVATKRENLHQLLFAYAISIIKNADGSVRFTFLNQTDVKQIPDSRIFYGGSVDVSDLATGIELTEHSFRALPTDREVTVFDNSDGSQGTAAHTLVIFQTAPCHDLVGSEGLTIHESGENYAIVSGIGTITAKAYTHITQVIKRTAEGTHLEENIRSVRNATLVTPLNSENVAKRLIAYYSAKNTVSMDIKLDAEKCGDIVSFTNPYGDSDAGYITELDATASSFIRAKAKIITRYHAQGFGNYYTHAVLLTGNGTWTVPSGASQKIRVVMIGGGSGGQGGTNGEAGTSGTASSSRKSFGSGGHGGAGGTAGEGGRILSVDIDDVSPGDSFGFSCGAGGAGGAVGGYGGAAGGDTSFDVYSTADGAISAAGAVNLLTGDVFGMPGIGGVDGGDGSSDSSPGESVIFGGQTYSGGENGGSAYGAVAIVMSYVMFAECTGGLGGGAAAGKNGGNGSSRAEYDRDYYTRAGRGADAMQAASVGLGCGGNGGHGGGGGGGGGYMCTYWSDDRQNKSWSGGTGGAGGAGSAGTSGGNGCIIVYY